MDPAKPTHVGLNLIFLVPGETGGMEVVARELIPALVAEAPAGIRFTAFVNREAAAVRGGPWGELLPAVTVPVNARNRVQWVLGEQTLLPRLAARAGVDLVHSLASTAPLWGRFRRVVTVHDLIYARFPEAHAGIRDKGMRVLVPAGGAPRGPGDRRLAEHARGPGGAARRSTRRGSTSCRSVSAPCARPSRCPSATCARASTWASAGRSESVGEAPAQEPARVDRRARADSHPSERPCSCSPAIRPRMSDELRARARDARGRRRTCAFPRGSPGAEVEGLWSIARAFVFPSLYEGFGLPVLEAMARGVPGGLLERFLAAGGGGRRGAAVRPAR